MKRIGILGAGTWGMALARMLTVSGNDVLVWSAIEKEIDSLSTTRKHPNLPQMKIPDELRFTKSIEEVCKDKARSSWTWQRASSPTPCTP